MKLQASHVPVPRVGPMVANRTTAINGPLEQIWNTVRRYWAAYTSSQSDRSLGRPWNAAESSQRQTCNESYLEREHNARWTALGVAHATSGITANVLTLLLPRSILARDQLNPYLQGAQGKAVEQWQSGANHNVRLHKGSVKPSTNLMPTSNVKSASVDRSTDPSCWVLLGIFR